MGKRSVSTVSVKDSQILRECPFCGGEAEMLTAESMNGGYLFGIMCNDCRSRGDVYDTEAEAIAAWNSRAERTCEFAPDGMMDDRLWFSCSNCGGYITTDYGMPSYCPHCGAKVVGE